MTKTTMGINPILRGSITGLLASVPMGMATMMLGLISGLGFTEPLRLIASALMGQAAFSGTLPLVLGLLLHMMTGAVLGILYGLLVKPEVSTPLLGIVFGLGVWVVATISLGYVAPIMAQNMPYWLFALAHAVYGLTLAVIFRR